MSAIDMLSAAWPSACRPPSPISFDTFDVTRLSATTWPDILDIDAEVNDIGASVTGWGDGEMEDPVTDRSEHPATTDAHSVAGSKPKKRGRPRLSPRENDDRTRRRAQIRLAQRAYRKRQTSAMEKLQQQVNEMGKLSGRLINSLSDISKELALLRVFEMRPAAAVAFNALVGDCISLRTMASSQAHEESDVDISNFQNEWDSTLQRCDWMIPRYSEPWPQSLPTSQHNLDQSTPERHRAEMSISSLLTASSPFTVLSSLVDPIPRRPTSFAHRVHLVCLERGYHLLRNPKSDMRQVMRTFGKTLAKTSRTSLIMQIETILRGNEAVAGTDWVISRPEQTASIYSPLLPAPPTMATSTKNEWLEPLDVHYLLLKSNIPIETDSVSIQLSSSIPQGQDTTDSTSNSPNLRLDFASVEESLEDQSSQARVFDVNYFLEILGRLGVCGGTLPILRRKEVEAAMYYAMGLGAEPRSNN
ncbi:hypothetical protein PFICI_05122 [Pestalotiopsis fici W106-1]|uniref:BZIP domain-containing protein n=1 Tax=Pestalotiopsis fici (strain W106-1 / CGMCC3.15140) TaxID=1229662 RepID=W3XDK5_PESFW|nr:uncharacterized protein PFICI_05122 [Pestalotiopsis fici W106-1]ETS83246.1 hypothetical protein PFICI_05122 [Pestalotiopsis fici W106-1]